MDNEKLLYLLKSVDFKLTIDIENVLNDSLDDPQYSAVTTSNLIKCYIEIMTNLGKKLPYHDVKGFILFDGFSEEEYKFFEASREKESKYYIVC